MTTLAERHSSIAAVLEQAAKSMFPKTARTSIDVRTRSATGDTALHMAALRGDATAVRKILTAGAFVDARGAGGRTALYYAALKGHLESARCLVAAGANPDLVMDLGMSPRTVAAQLRDRPLTELFARLGS
jgi:ankyrin repeat protein